jgi:hypothetical protein
VILSLSIQHEIPIANNPHTPLKASMGTFYKDDNLTILVNPSSARLKGFVERSGYKSLRGIIDSAGDLYVWDAEHMTHSDLDYIFGVDGLRVDVNESSVFVVLAGGAHELMVPPDNLEAFFDRHGHPGAALEDTGVIEGICDAACERVSSHRSFRGTDPSEIVADIDPRLPHGRTNLKLVGEMLSGYGKAPTRG